MPMGIVSDKDFEAEKSRIIPDTPPPPKVHVPVVVDMPRGRGEGNVAVPEVLKNLIGHTAINEGRQEAIELARNFGVSDSSTSAYSVGANSTATYNERPNAPFINKSKERVSKKARAKLLLAMKHITEDKLMEAKPRDLSGIARDMSTIMRDMEPEGPINPNDNGRQKPAFMVYAPKFFNENHYDVIVAKE